MRECHDSSFIPEERKSSGHRDLSIPHYWWRGGKRQENMEILHRVLRTILDRIVLVLLRYSSQKDILLKSENAIHDSINTHGADQEILYQLKRSEGTTSSQRRLC